LTVSPYLGSESLAPFVAVCRENGKGIFVLVKTSNTSSGEIQDVITAQGITVSQTVANYVAAQAEVCKGEYGYSPIGAVVGATYPREAESLRADMPHSYFLVPGYGAQGGGAEDVIPCFNPDGLGAIVNSSRGILYNHMTDAERGVCTKDEYLTRVKAEVLHMRDQLYSALKNKYPHMMY
jgi:orotidine-5'-phosphate decarboxylase